MNFTKLIGCIEENDTVMLYLGVYQIHNIRVQKTTKNKHGDIIPYVFQTQYGALNVVDLIGKEYGSKLQLPRGFIHLLSPTPELWTKTLPHRTQIIYTPDIAMILTELDIVSESYVCEAGTGSGSLSHAILRAIGPKGFLQTCDFHETRAQIAQEEFNSHGYAGRVKVEHRDVYATGWGVDGVADAVFMDLPCPQKGLPHALKAIKSSGGRICSFSPCIEQVSNTCSAMRAAGLTDINMVECLQKELQIKAIESNPVPYVKRSPKDLFWLNTNREIWPPKKFKSNEEDSEMKDISNQENSKKKPLVLGVEVTSNVNSSNSTKCKNTLNKGPKIPCITPPQTLPGHTGYLTFATVPPGLCIL